MKTSQVKKEKGQFCCAYSCKNKPVAKLGGLCHKHYRRKVRDRDPVYCRYNNFKNNAKARNKEFSITLKEFRDFCKRTGYIIKKGMRGQNATIDRVLYNMCVYLFKNMSIMSQEVEGYYLKPMSFFSGSLIEFHIYATTKGNSKNLFLASFFSQELALEYLQFKRDS